MADLPTPGKAPGDHPDLAFAAYMPSLIADRLIRSSGRWDEDIRFRGVALFADIAGFTSMSEAFAERRAAGAEELAGLLNGYFSAVVGSIRRWGGHVGKFGGDAVSAVFEFEDGRGAARALACAFEIQREMERSREVTTSVGVFHLTCKIGVAAGEVLATVGQLPGGRLEWILAGNALDLSAEAEHRAAATQVVADGSVRASVGDVAWTSLGDGFAVVEGPGPQLDPPPRTEPASLSAGAHELERALHPTIAARIAEGDRRLLGEHRPAAIMFAAFGVFDVSREEGARRLKHMTAEVLKIVQDLDGHLHQVDAGDKGTKAIVSFGAVIAHEDDDARALRCALRIRALDPDSVGIGIAAGVVFSGVVGGDVRREHTAIGDTVNIAARLMQRAEPGVILTTGLASPRVHRGFDLRGRPSITVKGRDGLVPLEELVGDRADLDDPLASVDERPIVGVDHELATGLEWVARAARGHGSVGLIVGEPGIGKTRLLAEIVRHAEPPTKVHAGVCTPTGSSTPFLPWRGILRSVVGVSADTPPSETVALLSDTLARSREGASSLAPLLAPVLGTKIPDSPTTTGLDPELRAQLRTSLLLDLLTAAAHAEPRLIVIEDMHWMDPASHEFLVALARAIRDVPLSFIATRRPQERGGIDLADVGDVERIDLHVHSEASMRILLDRTAASVLGLSENETEQLAAALLPRAQGNPFFLEELVRFLDRPALDPRDPVALSRAEAEIPDGLHRLVLARLDTLPAAEQSTVKFASVLGRRFVDSWIWRGFTTTAPEPEVVAHLDHLSDIEVMDDAARLPESEHQFHHAVMHEAAYATLSDASRRSFHDEVGRFLEDTFGDDDRFVDAIAYHVGMSADVDRQRTWFRRAAEAAEASDAAETAIGYYERLLPLLADTEVATTQRTLAELQQHAGRWTNAETSFRSAIRAADLAHDEREAALARAGIGYLLAHTGSTADARDVLVDARRRAEGSGDPALQERPLEYLAFATWQLADFDASMEAAVALRRWASAAGNRRALGMAIGSIALVHASRGSLPEAESAYLEAVEIAREIDDVRGLTHALNGLAQMRMELGDLGGALGHVREALEEASRVGYRHLEGALIGNAGELYRMHGQLELALRCTLRALELMVPLRDWADIATRFINIVLIEADRGRWVSVDRFLDLVTALLDAIGDAYTTCLFRLERAEIHARRGKADDALTLAEAAGAEALDAGFGDVRWRSQILTTRLWFEVGAIDRRAALEAIDSSVVPGDPVAHRAAAAHAAWSIDPADRSRTEAARHLLREAFIQMPTPEHRRRLVVLGESDVPEPTPLRELPDLPASTGTLSLDDAFSLGEDLQRELRATNERG